MIFDFRVLKFCDYNCGMGLDQKSFENLKLLFLARMLCRETRSFFFSGLVNLDEVDGVSMMSTDAEHQRLFFYGHRHRGRQPILIRAGPRK